LKNSVAGLQGDCPQEDIPDEDRAAVEVAMGFGEERVVEWNVGF
jgi:hypothetical protein